MEMKDGASTAIAQPSPSPSGPPDSVPETVYSSSSDDDEGTSVSEIDPYNYSDLADRNYYCEIESIPSFNYMSASQRMCNQSFRGQEPGPSATDLTPNVTVPVVGNLDDIIQRLVAVRTSGRPRMVQLFESEIRYLCMAARGALLAQPMLLELETPIKICGDIHGQYTDLLRLFEYGGFPPSAKYLFLGNYVNMGRQSIETMCLLLAYKIRYPEKFFLLRGNHESAAQSRICGFFDECQHRFSVKLWNCFVDCFNCLPVAASLDDKIFCMHSGLSPDLSNMEQIRAIRRPVDVPDSGLLSDLLWSDPSKDIQEWEVNDNERVSYKFGAKVIKDFLTKHDLDIICRSNKVVEDGFEFFANKQLVSIFSAPNFRGQYGNAAAMINVDEDLLISFQILKPAVGKRLQTV